MTVPSTIDHLQDIFDLRGSDVELTLTTVPGSNHQEQTINVALLLLIGYCLLDQHEVSTHRIRQTCKHYDCLDAPHFMRTLKRAEELMTVTGTRRAYRASLTEQGRARGLMLATSLQKEQQQTQINALLVSRYGSTPICEELGQLGFNLVSAESTEDAIHTMRDTGMPDAIVIDGRNGFLREAQLLCRQLSDFSDLPIVLLSDESRPFTISDSLSGHLSIFTAQPLVIADLAQHIRNLVAEVGQLPYDSSEVQIDHQLRIDFISRLAYVKGKAVPLTPLETRILFMLLRQRGHTVSDDFICQRLGYALNEPGIKENLTVYISRLRRKLATDEKTNYIRPQYGAGYRFFSPYSGVSAV